MRWAPATSLAPALALMLASCVAGSGASEPAPPRLDASSLPALVIQAAEAPPGVELLEETSGPTTLEDLWPSSCCPEQQQAFDEAGFGSAYRRMFRRPGASADPIDTRPGLQTVASAAVLFRDPGGASAAMRTWMEYFDSPTLEPLPTEGLGDDAHGLVGSPNAPAETVVLYFWRIGRVVLHVRATGGTGTVHVDQIRSLVDRVQARAA